MKKYKCSKCGGSKKYSEFAKDNRRKDGVGSWCKECKNKTRREFNKNNPKVAKKQWRKNNLKSKYGISLEDYDRMLFEQGGVCAICGKKEKRKNKYGKTRLCVDHNHSNKKVRKLLCSACNWLVGIVETNDLSLIDDYLERYK